MSSAFRPALPSSIPERRPSMPTTSQCCTLASLISSLVALTGAGCLDVEEDDVGTSESALSWGDLPSPGPTTKNTPIGIALEIEDGVPTPIQVRKNQRVYINQLDLRAAVVRTVDEGVAGLDQVGAFADLDWRGTTLADESFVSTPNPDGTFTRRRMYRKSRWMDAPSFFLIEQLDAHGRTRGLPILIDTGLEYLRTDFDSFFARRLRAIQWTNDCPSSTDCRGAKSFMEEALVELRYANGPHPSFQFDSATTQLRVTWTANLMRPYTIPVQQVANPTWDYGFGIDLAVTTPPAANGTYAPGQTLTVKFTLRDGGGKALHAPGVLPTFLDYLSGNTPSG
ncbi:MAG: cytochrome C, partial [Kofleriaceae bacterium]